MVCLAVWMSYSGRSLMDKAMIMVLPVAMFVASGFEHSIANMFMIPMGIVIRNFASPEFWTAIGSTPESFSHLTVMNFITDNLIPVTIGEHYRRGSAGRVDILGHLPAWQRPSLRGCFRQ